MNQLWKKLGYALLGLVLSMAVSACSIQPKENEATSEAYTVTDATGAVVTIPKKPVRILADSSSLDTMILGIVPADHLVAVSFSTKDPAISYVADVTAGIKKTIPLTAGVSMEDLASLNPDIIICSNYSKPKDVELYKSMGFPVVIVKGPTSVTEVENAVRLIGAALGEKERGEKVVSQMEAHFAHIEDVLSKENKPEPTALLISQMTSYGGPGSMYHELLTKAHIKNAMEKMGVANGQLMSLEKMVESDPDFLFVSKDRASDETGAGKFREGILANPAIQSMRAYQHIIPLDDKYIYASTQNCVYAVEAMANAAYGPLFDLSHEANIKGY